MSKIYLTAASRSLTINLDIPIIAFIAAADLDGSGLPRHSPSCFGIIYQERPNLSLSQPHLPGVPPSAVSASQHLSTSDWSLHKINIEKASEKVNISPPLRAVYFAPRSSNSTVNTPPSGRLVVLIILDFSKRVV